MTRIAHIIRELGRNLKRNAGTALASLLSLTLLFLLFDLFWIGAGTADRFYRELLSELRVEVFVDESWPDSSITDVSAGILEVTGILDYEYISRDQARQRLADMVGADLLVGYEGSNPLPRSYILTVDGEYLNGSALNSIETELRAIEGVGDIYYSRDWLDKAERAKSIILKVGLILGVLIIAAALITTANSIRLMTRARAVGFRQMLLQGAGRLFIAFPFFVESFLISGLSATLGWGLVLYGRTQVGLARVEIVFPTRDEIVLFCVVLACLGAVSSYLGLRRLLKA
jgi:cell division protein FtsX